MFSLICFLCFLAMALAQDTSGPAARVLLFSATRGYRHDSIPTAIRRLRDRGLANSPRVLFDDSEDPAQFSDANLSKYDAIVLLLTTGEILDDAGKRAFQTYLNLGGNFVGVHSATDTINQTDFYQREVGAFFDYHPEIQDGDVLVLDRNHPSTSMLPERWTVRDEFYNFKSDPRDVGAQVILSIDESSYTDTGPRGRYDQGSPHPLAWYQNQGAGASSPNVAGRSWYTSLGHTIEMWEDDLFLDHVIGGISWALGSNKTRAFNSTASVGNEQSARGTQEPGSSSQTTTSQSPSSTSNSKSTSIASYLLSGLSASLVLFISLMTLIP